MTYRKLGISVVALVTAIFAGTVAVAPVAGASGGAGSTRLVPSAGTTSYSPTADGADAGFGQPELGGNEAVKSCHSERSREAA